MIPFDCACVSRNLGKPRASGDDPIADLSDGDAPL